MQWFIGLKLAGDVIAMSLIWMNKVDKISTLIRLARQESEEAILSRGEKTLEFGKGPSRKETQVTVIPLESLDEDQREHVIATAHRERKQYHLERFLSLTIAGISPLYALVFVPFSIVWLRC